MMSIALNWVVDTSNPIQLNLHNEILANFLKLRFKNKSHVNLYLTCLKELVKASDDKNLPILMKHVIFNEMSNSNNPNNLLIFNVLFDYNQIPSTVPTTTVSNDLAAASMATGFVEVLLQKGPTLYLKPLRALLRKIMSSLRNDTTLNLYEFSFHLMNNKSLDGNQLRRSECQEIVSSIIDLINLSMFLCVTPNVRDSMNSYIR